MERRSILLAAMAMVVVSSCGVATADMPDGPAIVWLSQSHSISGSAGSNTYSKTLSGPVDSSVIADSVGDGENGASSEAGAFYVEAVATRWYGNAGADSTYTFGLTEGVSALSFYIHGGCGGVGIPREQHI